MSINKWTFDGFISESQLNNFQCLAKDDSSESNIQIQIYDRSLVATTFLDLLTNETTRILHSIYFGYVFLVSWVLHQNGSFSLCMLNCTFGQ